MSSEFVLTVAGPDVLPNPIPEPDPQPPEPDPAPEPAPVPPLPEPAPAFSFFGLISRVPVSGFGRAFGHFSSAFASLREIPYGAGLANMSF